MSSPDICVGVLSSGFIEFKFFDQYQLVGTNCIFSGDASVRFEKGTIKLAGTEISRDELHFVPCNEEQSGFELKDVTIGVNFHWEQKETQRFQGGLKFIVETDKVTATNILPLEDYLISVISSEMSAKSSLPLLKAHAIISRSWLLAQIEKRDKLSDAKEHYENISETGDEYIKWYDREDHKNYHVCADDHCQRYQGTTRSHNKNVLKAVRETAGVVLSYKGAICDARFSKCCGGISELFENCWEPVNHPYLTSVVDNPHHPAGYKTDLTLEENAIPWIKNTPEAFCNTNNEEVLKQVLNEYDWTAKNFFRWTVAYSQDELSALILKRSGHDFGKILDMVAMERGTSGRIIKLKIIGSKKTLTVGKELEIRRWLSESHLYSSAFTVEKDAIVDDVPQKFVLHGAGWGHGVGLCQIGAAVMGHKGYKYDEILSHYFKNTTLEKRY